MPLNLKFKFKDVVTKQTKGRLGVYCPLDGDPSDSKCWVVLSGPLYDVLTRYDSADRLHMRVCFGESKFGYVAGAVINKDIPAYSKIKRQVIRAMADI